MSHHHHELGDSWEDDLNRELRKFQGDDERKRANQAKLDRIWKDVFLVVINRFIEDARRDGMTARLSATSLTFECLSAPTVTFNFQLSASSKGIAISANGGGYCQTFVKTGDDPETITHQKVADFLIAALKTAQPKS